MKPLKDMDKEELIAEIKKLRKSFIIFSRISDWDNMYRGYGRTAAEVNIGEKPRTPHRWW